LVDLVALLPIVGREHLLDADPVPHAPDADPLHLVERHLTVAGGLAAPIDVGVAVRDRDQEVERAHAARGQRRIGDRRVLHVHGGIAAQDVPRLDVGEVVAVVLGEI
ncbi:MAG: hypothetical protein ACK56I_20110, partial [bacterium]